MERVMSCPDHQTLIAFLDQEIAPAESTALERHLAHCLECDAFVKELQALQRTCESSLKNLPSATLQELDFLKPRRRFLGWQIPLKAAAALMACLCVLGLLLAHRLQRSPGDFSQPSLSRTEVSPPEAADASPARGDAAFERWAAPYRRLRVPLVPLEQLARYQPPLIPPLSATPSAEGQPQ
jgi:hypothetical protein